MKVETRKIEELKAAPYNPRLDLKPGDAEYEKLKRSVQEFGLVETIVFNESTGYVVGGHQRLKVLKDLGYTEVPVSVVSLPDDKERALNVALNKISGDWDTYKLRELLIELDESDLGIELTGFDMEDLDGLIDEFNSTLDITEPEEDEFDSSEMDDEEYIPFTKRGEVWELGKHRLMCGDSTSIADVGVLMNGQKADMVFTDPPYGVSYKSNMSKRFDVLKNDDEFLNFIPCLLEYSKDNIHWYIWTSHHVYPIWRHMFNDYYKHTIIWAKGGGGMGDLEGNYASDYEMALFCHFGRKELLGKRSGAVWEINKDGAGLYVHPTQKPVALATEAINHSSVHNDNVLDLFGGSGSTLIACEQAGRINYSMELDEKYCDVIIRRWETFTGKTARKLS